MIKTVMIVDDEPLARINLRTVIEKYTDWEIVLELTTGEGVEQHVEKLQPQLIFMDIRMPKRNGISATVGLRKLTNPPLVVFTSAYSEYALQAFELYALDYLLKPFSDERFIQTVTRLNNIAGKVDLAPAISLHPVNSTPHKDYLKVLIIRSIGMIQIVDLNDVIWFRGCGNYVEVMLDDEKYLHRVPMNFLQENLDPNVFVRCHRSAIVRLSAIKDIKSQDDNRLSLGLKNGDTLQLSQTYKYNIIEQLER